MKWVFVWLLVVVRLSCWAQIDSSTVFRLVDDKLIDLSYWGKTEVWGIYGSDSSKVFHIDSCGLFKEITDLLRTATRSKFTSLVAVGEGQLMLGTADDFALKYDRGVVARIDSSAGITERSLLLTSFNPDKSRVYFEGAHCSFASIDSSFLHYAAFAAVETDASIDEREPDADLDDEADEFDDPDDDWTSEFFDSLKSSVTGFIPEIKGGNGNHKPYISYKQFRNIRKKLQPSDILFKRTNWQWSNNIIPGFWTHTAIYVGGLHQLNIYFKGIPMLKGKKPSSYIRKHFPRIYRRLLSISHPIIEAIPEKGVSINKLRHIARVDYFAALRPELSKEDQFLTLLKAFGYYKMPYDYWMNFNNKKAMVCSQLVYEAFQPTVLKQGLSFELASLLGEPFLYPSDIVRKFDQEYGTEDEELDFVLFYNAKETEKKAELGTVLQFRKTWKKSRFSLMQD